jgi:uncharacterized protein
MDERVLREYVRQYIDSQQTPTVTFTWQGGEPTLLGIEFFETVVRLQQEYCPPGKRVENCLQTNGTRLDDRWGRFLHKHRFLVGISIDGPARLHDAYRVDKQGGPTFGQVVRGIEVLKLHQVDFNVLTAVHSANVGHPREVYRFLRDKLKAGVIQFIPIVETDEVGSSEKMEVTSHSVTGKKYGEFLISVFDQWVERDVGQVFVQLFEMAVSSWLGLPPSLCVFRKTCGDALVVEHNGDLYSCDHFVDGKHKLGNICDTSLLELAQSDRQRQFGSSKENALPQFCRRCPVQFVCNGGCPKNRISQSPDGEPGLNYLCEGYRDFFTHVDRPLRIMAAAIRTGRPAPCVSHRQVAEATLSQEQQSTRIGRNDACPCGSGRKYKYCCWHRQRD